MVPSQIVFRGHRTAPEHNNKHEGERPQWTHENIAWVALLQFVYDYFKMRVILRCFSNITLCVQTSPSSTLKKSHKNRIWIYYLPSYVYNKEICSETWVQM